MAEKKIDIKETGLREQARSKVKNCENLSYASKEAFKRLRTNIVMSFQGEEKKHRVIGVTSAQPSEGKSTISLNLAYTLAELGGRVLLLDADLRRPSIHQKLDIDLAPGLSLLLEGSNAVGSTIYKYKSSTSETELEVIPGGDIPSNPSELLNSKRMKDLVKALKNVYDYVIIDLPPIGAVIDAIPVSQCTDGMVVVVRENNCPQNVLNDCIEQLKFADVKILGFVVNGALEGAGKKYQYGNYN